MTKQIALSNGGYALVDDADFEWLRQYTWSQTKGYVQGTVDGRKVGMHQLLMECGPGQEVDHRNRIRHDNQRHNLRAVTHSENLKNRGKHRGASSIYRGVTKAKWCRLKWHAAIRFGGKTLFLGAFGSEEAAARRYDEAARQLLGVEAPVNFP